MNRLLTFVFIGLFVLITHPATAEDGKQPAQSKCVKDADLDVEEANKADSNTSDNKALHRAGAKLARNFICHGDKACLERNGKRLTEAAHTIVDVCLQDPEIPKYMCLGFVANAANEGGMREHPTCGGISQSCIKRCDAKPNGSARRACAISCAIDQGLRGPRMQRARKCNDSWTSKGPFQMKTAFINRCKRWFGPNFDPFDTAQAAQCMMKKIKRTATSKKWPCTRADGNRWMISMKRVGAGPLRTVEKAQKAGCFYSTTKNERLCVKAAPAKRVQRCDESSYAKRGLRYYRSCGKACRLVKRTPPKHKAQPLIGSNRTLTQKTN